MSDMELLKRAAGRALRWQAEIGGDMKAARRQIWDEIDDRQRPGWRPKHKKKRAKSRKRGRPVVAKSKPAI